jgi:hypothetical protein
MATKMQTPKAQTRESGQATAVLVLFLGTVMLGFMGFALDVGYFFHERRMAQAAADGAALIAAEESGYGNTSNMQGAANAVATLNGFNTSATTNPATVVLTTSTTGAYSSSGGSAPSGWVQATVSQPVSGIFLSAFDHASTTLTISATAIAGTGTTSTTCVCLEGTSGMDLNLSNGTKLQTNSCGITVNSSSSNAVGVVGGSTLSALTLGSVSPNWDTSSNVNNGGSVTSTTKVVEGLANGCSPSLPAVPVDTSCSVDPFTKISNGGSSYTVGPGSSYGTTQGGNTICYNSLTIGANGDTVTLNSGIYVINGGTLHFESQKNLGGSGVIFYLENGASLVLDNGANISLTAPTSGTYQGVLFYQAPSDTNAISLQGGSSSTISGSILAPGAALTIGNGSASAVSSAIVASTLTMNGGGTLTATATSNLGSMSLSGSRLVQ